VDVFGEKTESVQKRFFNDSTVGKMLSRKRCDFSLTAGKGLC
jgi:hypothetical protein